MLPIDSTLNAVQTIVNNLYAAIAAVTAIIGALSALVGHHIGFKKGQAAGTAAANGNAPDPKSGRI
jgi:hypothetical protein